MVISAVLRLGCSNSVSRVFEEKDSLDVAGSGRDTLDIDAFVLLGTFEMDPVPFAHLLLHVKQTRSD